MDFFLRPVDHLIACVVLKYTLAWLSSFPPSTISSKILPSQFSLFTIFQLFHSSRVSRQHPGRCVSSAYTPQTNSHKVCSLLKLLEDNAVTNSETSIFPPFPLFLVIALPLGSHFPPCHRRIHFPNTAALCVGSPLKSRGALFLRLHSHSRQMQEMLDLSGTSWQQKLSSSRSVECLPEDFGLGKETEI